MQRMKLDLYFTLSVKINSRCTKDLILGAKIFLEENLVKNLHDTGFGKDGMDMTPKSTS